MHRIGSISLALILACAVPAHSFAQQARPVPPSTTPAAPQATPDDIAQQVSVILQVDCDTESSNRMDAQGVAALLSSTAVIDAAVKAALNLDPPKARQLVTVSPSSVNYRFTRLDVALRKSGSANWKSTAASDLQVALCNQLKAAVEESARAARVFQKARQNDLAKQIEETAARLQEIRSQLRTARNALGAQAGEYSDVQYAIRNIRSQRTTVENELNRARARLAAIEASTSPQSAAWEQVVTLLTQRVADLEKQAGQDPAKFDELQAARKKLAEAKVQRAEMERAESTASNRYSRSSEAPQLRAQIAETEERLKPLVEATAKLEDPKLQKLFDQLPDLQQQEQRMRSELSELKSRHENFRRTLQYEPRVVITVLDGKPDGQ